MATQNINVTSTNPVDFVSRILELGSKGATLKERTCPRLKGLPYAAELVYEVEGTEPLQVGPGVNAIPVALSELVYTKEQLEAMPIEDIRPILASRGIKGRDKRLMIKEYLETFEVKDTE
jgi:hypothetical protein